MHMMDEQLHINPTLLSLFRLFVWLQISLASWFVVLRWYNNSPRFVGVPLVALLIFIATALLLQSRYLQQQLQGAYLPAALTLVTIGLSLGRPLVQLAVLSNGHGPIATLLQSLSYGNVGTLWDSESTPMLFFPLVLIAWQYSLREILLFIAVTMG
ncbi:MAG: hypothetical protein KC547_09730, partial [Anaerolineae bacterium]|nr:hypothetical protein [Anaerolineae bacterium]